MNNLLFTGGIFINNFKNKSDLMGFKNNIYISKNIIFNFSSGDYIDNTKINNNSKNNNKNNYNNSNYCDFLLGSFNLTNWEELNNKYLIYAKNEKDFLFSFLLKFGINKIDELKGSYSIIFKLKNKIYLFRDIVGIFPICFSFDKKLDSFYFALENKLILSDEKVELNPRKYVEFNLDNFSMKILNRKNFFSLKKIENNFNETKLKVYNLLKKDIKKSILNSKKIGILFSGGTDSTLLALTLKAMGVDFKCYTTSIGGGNIQEGIDIFYARKIAKELNLDWELVNIDLENVENMTREIIDIIEDRNYTKVSVALTFYAALKYAKKQGVDTMFIGIGSEEIFADYKRDDETISYNNINKVCMKGLKSLWIRDMYRDGAMARKVDINLIFPFLDNDFINYSININPKFKIDKENKINKIILREIIRDFNLLSSDLVDRKKTAAQYGSKSDRIYEKLSKKKRMLKQEYLNSI